MGVNTRASQLKGSFSKGHRSSDCVNERTGMAESVCTLQTAEVICWSPIRKAIGIARGDVEGIEDAKPIFEIRHLRGKGSRSFGGQIPQRAPQAMAPNPNLLAEMQMQGLESFFRSLVAGKTGPFMVAPIGTELGLGQIGLGLMQPVERVVHPPMLPFCTGFTTGFGRGGQQVAWLWEHLLPLEDAWLPTGLALLKHQVDPAAPERRSRPRPLRSPGWHRLDRTTPMAGWHRSGNGC